MKTQFYIGAESWAGTSKVIEESGEIGQVLGKLIGSNGDIHHFDGSNLEDKMVEEIGDFYAALSFFVDKNLVHRADDIAERVMKKIELFEQWHEEELSKGTK